MVTGTDHSVTTIPATVALHSRWLHGKNGLLEFGYAPLVASINNICVIRNPCRPLGMWTHSSVIVGGPSGLSGHIVGVDNLMWGSDYPHVVSTFPRSQQILEEILEDCTDEEKAKIAGGNAARVYQLN